MSAFGWLHLSWRRDIAAQCLVIAILYVLVRPPAFTEAHFQRIVAGMTEKEVSAVLGRPAGGEGATHRSVPIVCGPAIGGKYPVRFIVGEVEYQGPSRHEPTKRYLGWFDGRMVIYVEFEQSASDGEFRVVDRNVQPLQQPTLEEQVWTLLNEIGVIQLSMLIMRKPQRVYSRLFPFTSD